MDIEIKRELSECEWDALHSVLASYKRDIANGAGPDRIRSQRERIAALAGVAPIEVSMMYERRWTNKIRGTRIN